MHDHIHYYHTVEELMKLLHFYSSSWSDHFSQSLEWCSLDLHNKQRSGPDKVKFYLAVKICFNFD